MNIQPHQVGQNVHGQVQNQNIDAVGNAPQENRPEDGNGLGENEAEEGEEMNWSPRQRDMFPFQNVFVRAEPREFLREDLQALLAAIQRSDQDIAWADEDWQDVWLHPWRLHRC